MTDVCRWFENMTYAEAKAILQENMTNMKMSFIAAGYYLKYIRDKELFREDGFGSIWEFAEDNYGIKKSTASRWMAMNDKFSKGGNSPILADEYKGFEKSQLQEMLYLDDKQIETVQPNMTVKEIRKVRKLEEPVIELNKPDERDQEYLKAAAKHLIKGLHDWFLQDFTNRVMMVDKSPQELKDKLGKDHRCWHFSTKNGVARIDLFDDYVQIWDEQNEYIGDFDWFYLAAKIQSMWNIVAVEGAQKSQQESVATSQHDDEEQLPGQMNIEDYLECLPDQYEVEAADAEVVETENLPEAEKYEELSDQTDMDLLYGLLDKEKHILQLMLENFTENDIRVRKQKLTVGAYTGMIADLGQCDIPETIQPELPRFKNNDQRKEWLHDYKAWGLWYEDKNIGARYYKYDFNNGARLIAETYIHPGDKYMPEHESCFLHLVGGPEPTRKSGVSKWVRHERYDRFPSNETELVEFLKYIQKEGK